MPWNLLIIPLVAGYFFLTRSYFFKYRYRLLDRQRLLLESVIVASLFLIAAYGIALVCVIVVPPEWMALYRTYRPVPFTATALLTFLFSLIATYPVNLFTSPEKEMNKAINIYGSALEKILLKAIESPQQICFTLDNGKVYVGYPLSIYDLVNPGMVTILPFFSGYRNEEHFIKITTFYEDFYNDIFDENPDNDNYGFKQLIAVNRIITAKPFDIDTYDKLEKYEK